MTAVVVLSVCATVFLIASLAVGLVLGARPSSAPPPPPSPKRVEFAERRRVLERARAEAATILERPISSHSTVREQSLARVRECDDQLIALSKEEAEHVEAEARAVEDGDDYLGAAVERSRRALVEDLERDREERRRGRRVG